MCIAEFIQGFTRVSTGCQLDLFKVLGLGEFCIFVLGLGSFGILLTSSHP